MVNGVLLRPLPFAMDADRLMVVSYWPTYTKGNLGAPAMLGRDYVTFQRENRSFERVALIIPYGAQHHRGAKRGRDASRPRAGLRGFLFSSRNQAGDRPHVRSG